MSGEAKKRMKSVVCAGIVTLLLAGCARANLVDSNSIVQDGIEYYMQTDKSVYDLGENVEMLYRVTNLTDEAVRIYCSQVPEFNIWVKKEGETIWFLYLSALPVILGSDLSAGESKELSHSWDMKDYNGSLVGVGVYNVVGVMYNEPWNYDNHGNYSRTEVGIPITVIPEPGSLALFMASLSILSCFIKKKEVKHI